jgi:hypothetical protein
MMSGWHRESIHKIYVASSWRNGSQPATVLALRNAGFDPYDFRNPRGDGTGFFGWERIDPNWKEWKYSEYIKALRHPVAIDGFLLDYDHLRAADALVLVLPCNRSSHLEAGIAIGYGKPVVIINEGHMIEPELMYLAADALVDTVYDAIEIFKRFNDAGIPPTIEIRHGLAIGRVGYHPKIKASRSTGRIRARSYGGSKLLRDLIDLLYARGKEGCTGVDMFNALNILNPSTLVAELRANGFRIRTEYRGKTDRGRNVYAYVLEDPPKPMFERKP